MPHRKDPLGKAITDYFLTGEDRDILVESDVCEEDVLSSAYLFRTYEEMPAFEQMALELAQGKILDIGAGAGAHSMVLKARGADVRSIDVSPGAVETMQKRGLDARLISLFDLHDEKYDTLLFLMNGIGIGGHISELPRTLLQAKSLLTPGGKILFDSTDIRYLYEDDEGGYWIDLHADYYGNVEFRMHYKDEICDWFNWSYIDFHTMQDVAAECGLKVHLLHEEDSQYLAEITVL